MKRSRVAAAVIVIIGRAADAALPWHSGLRPRLEPRLQGLVIDLVSIYYIVWIP
jgi:hypothetical protein